MDDDDHAPAPLPPASEWFDLDAPPDPPLTPSLPRPGPEAGLHAGKGGGKEDGKGGKGEGGKGKKPKEAQKIDLVSGGGAD